MRTLSDATCLQETLEHGVDMSYARGIGGYPSGFSTWPGYIGPETIDAFISTFNICGLDLTPHLTAGEMLTPPISIKPDDIKVCDDDV